MLLIKPASDWEFHNCPSWQQTNLVPRAKALETTLDHKQERSNLVTRVSHLAAFPGRTEETTWEGKRTLLESAIFFLSFNACASRVTWRVILTLESTLVFGSLNFCLFITCITIRFDGQFREWASTRCREPMLASGSRKVVIGYTCGLQVLVLRSFQKLQRSLTLPAMESTYELVTSLLGWNLPGLDDTFTAKWSCKDLFTESIKWWTLSKSHSWSPLDVWDLFSTIITWPLMHLLFTY